MTLQVYSTAEGEWIDHRVVFNPGSANLLKADLRTDESFASKAQPGYHRGTSPLLQLNTKMISQIPLDTMHLIYLGIMKRMLKRSFNKKRCSYTLRDTEVAESYRLSKRLLQYLPQKFKRKRGLDLMPYFEAEEYRRIANYDGYSLFKKTAPSRAVQFVFALCLCSQNFK